MNQPSQNPFLDIRHFFKQKSVLSYLVIINIVVWILIQIFRVLAFLFDKPDSAAAFSSVVVDPLGPIFSTRWRT